MTVALPSPTAQATGISGTLHIGGLHAGTLTKWRVVISPKSTPERVWYTLFGEGMIGRFYTQSIGCQARAVLVPSAQPTRIGRKRPPTPRPFAFAGKVVEVSARRIVLAEGTTGPP